MEKKLRLYIRWTITVWCVLYQLFIYYVLQSVHRKVQCRQIPTHMFSLCVPELLVAASISRNMQHYGVHTAHPSRNTPNQCINAYLPNYFIVYTFLRKPRHRWRHEQTDCMHNFARLIPPQYFFRQWRNLYIYMAIATLMLAQLTLRLYCIYFELKERPAVRSRISSKLVFASWIWYYGTLDRAYDGFHVTSMNIFSVLRGTKSDSMTAVELRGVHRVYLYNIYGIIWYVVLKVCT